MRILHAHYVLHGALRQIVSVFIITREANPTTCLVVKSVEKQQS